MLTSHAKLPFSPGWCYYPRQKDPLLGENSLVEGPTRNTPFDPWLYLSILSSARPGPLARPTPSPPTNLIGRAWVEILKPAKIFLARAQPEMLFLVVLHYKCAGGPPKPGPDPSPAQKLRPNASSGMVMGRIFSAWNNIIFFSPARPEKCSGLPVTKGGPLVSGGNTTRD
jgi:hypothetical protein